MKDEVHVLSLGAGVQSSTMLLMALHDEITPFPDFIIFADTGWEPREVYEHVRKLEQVCKDHGTTLHVVGDRNIRDDLMEQVELQQQGVGGKKSFSNLPFYVINEKGEKAIAKRQCTAEYKIRVIQKAVRDLLGYVPKQRVKEKVFMWRGISTDEIERVAPSRERWIENRHPLIEKWMSRLDCLNWMQRKGYPQPPKSSCVGCPFHSDHMWLDMKRNHPEEWQDAIEVDRAIKGLKRLNGRAFLHRSCVPLEEVNLNENQLEFSFEGFGNECAGVCGV